MTKLKERKVAMSEINKITPGQTAGTNDAAVSADNPEMKRQRLLKPVHEENIPEHVGDKNVCTIDTLLQKILDDEKQYDLSKIVSAYELAEQYHHEQKRESGEPYITHPLAVAYILLEP